MTTNKFTFTEYTGEIKGGRGRAPDELTTLIEAAIGASLTAGKGMLLAGLSEKERAKVKSRSGNIGAKLSVHISLGYAPTGDLVLKAKPRPIPGATTAAETTAEPAVEAPAVEAPPTPAKAARPRAKAAAK